MRLIDADELLSIVRSMTVVDKSVMHRILIQMPTVDAVPVRRGQWIDETFKPWGLVHHPYKCDQCGDHSEAPSDYCPHCGARMDGKDSDDGKTD